MASAAVDAMLGSTHAFAVAAAGCGKTELLGQLVADPRSGRQLVLTHTHAGVAALKNRLAGLRVPHDKFHLDTIAGWCLRYGAAYPAISGYRRGAEADPDWTATYPGAEKVCRTALGKKVISESYNGVLVDEYQDCSLKQHALVSALAEVIPCRGVGDPLQTIFGFRDDPVVPWTTIKTDFEVVDDALTEPWRWRRQGRNAALGEWLVAARKQLEETGRLFIAEDAPVTWVQHDTAVEPPDAWASTCRGVSAPSNETVVAILKWPSKCKDLARRMGGPRASCTCADDAGSWRSCEAHHRSVDASSPCSAANSGAVLPLARHAFTRVFHVSRLLLMPPQSGAHARDAEGRGPCSGYSSRPKGRLRHARDRQEPRLPAHPCRLSGRSRSGRRSRRIRRPSPKLLRLTQRPRRSATPRTSARSRPPHARRASAHREQRGRGQLLLQQS